MRIVPFASRLGVVVLGVAFAASCGSPSQNACSTNGSCPNEKPRSQSMIDNCNMHLNHPTCGAKYQAALACLSSHEQCDSAGNVDAIATEQACAPQVNDWMACAAGPDAGAAD